MVNWEAIGAVGDVLGAIGVIVTLAYLAVQMRINTIALRNETLRDSMQMVIDSYSTVIAHEDIAALYLKGMEDFEALSAIEQIRFHYVCCQRLHAASVTFSLRIAAGKDDVGFVETQLEPWIGRMMQRRGFRQWWDARGHATMTPEFVAFAESVRKRDLSASR